MMRTQVFGGDGDRPTVRNVAMIITDGKPTDPTTVPAAIDAVHNSGCTTLVVGVTDQVDEGTLKQLSSPPSQVNHISSLFHRNVYRTKIQLIVSFGPSQAILV